LELRPFHARDAEALHALFTDSAVRRWLLDDAIVPRGWVDEEIGTSEHRFASGSAGLWSVWMRSPSSLVGFVGFRPFWDPPQLELVYGLHPAHWGQGLATEASDAVVLHGFETLGFVEVRAATDTPNTASVAVLQRLGFVETGRSEDGPAGTIRFALDVGRWRERRRGPPHAPR
jgi:ribosomal-protein-alanine N-acetyltransferase